MEPSWIWRQIEEDRMTLRMRSSALLGVAAASVLASGAVFGGCTDGNRDQGSARWHTTTTSIVEFVPASVDVTQVVNHFAAAGLPVADLSVLDIEVTSSISGTPGLVSAVGFRSSQSQLTPTPCDPAAIPVPCPPGTVDEPLQDARIEVFNSVSAASKRAQELKHIAKRIPAFGAYVLVRERIVLALPPTLTQDDVDAYERALNEM